MSIKDENVSNCKHESVEQSRLEIKKYGSTETIMSKRLGHVECRESPTNQ